MVNFGSVECGETYKRRPVCGGVATVEGRFFCWGGSNLLVYLCFLCVRFVFVLMVRTKTTLRRGRRKMGRSRSTMRVRSRSLRRGTLRSRRQGGIIYGSTSLEDGRDEHKLIEGCKLVAIGKFHKKCTFNNKSQWKVRSFKLYIDEKSEECRILYFENRMYGGKELLGTRMLSQMMMVIPEDNQNEIHFTAQIQSGESMPKDTTEPLKCKFDSLDYIESYNAMYQGKNAVNKLESILTDPSRAERLTPTPPSPAASN